MKETPVQAFYFIHHKQGIITRMEDFAARRTLVAVTEGNKAVRRLSGQDRLAMKLTKLVPDAIVVAAGLALAGERYPGAAHEPYTVNAGLALLGSEQATGFIAGQADLFSQTLQTYEQIQDQQRSQQPHAPRVPLKFLPALDPDLDNILRLGLALRRLKDAVQGDTQKTQAVERVLRR